MNISTLEILFFCLLISVLTQNGRTEPLCDITIVPQQSSMVIPDSGYFTLSCKVNCTDEYKNLSVSWSPSRRHLAEGKGQIFHQRANISVDLIFLNSNEAMSREYRCIVFSENIPVQKKSVHIYIKAINGKKIFLLKKKKSKQNIVFTKATLEKNSAKTYETLDYYDLVANLRKKRNGEDASGEFMDSSGDGNIPTTATGSASSSSSLSETLSSTDQMSPVMTASSHMTSTNCAMPSSPNFEEQETTDKKGKDSPVYTDKSNFGKYGVIAFAVSLSIAFVLLYTLLMIIFMPRLLAKRKAKCEFNYSSAIYKKKCSGIDEVVPMTLASDVTTTEIDVDEDLEVKNVKDISTPTEQDSEPAVSSFLLRQKSLSKKHDIESNLIDTTLSASEGLVEAESSTQDKTEASHIMIPETHPDKTATGTKQDERVQGVNVENNYNFFPSGACSGEQKDAIDV